MKKIYKRLNGKNILLLIMMITLVSCEDFFDLVPKNQATDATIWQTPGNADLFLNNVYAAIGQIANGQDAFNVEAPGDNWTDDAFGKPNNFSTSVYRRGIYTSANNQVSFWGQYNHIRKANVFIEKVTASPTLPDDYKKLRIAEARFLRAYFYYLLWTHHGGVPIITNVLNITEQGDAVFQPRNTDAETFQFIVDELAAIVPDLPLKTTQARVTRGAALTLKGACELFWASPFKNTTNDLSRWATAAATNKQVMDLDVYSLFPDYETLFFEQNENCDEVILVRSHVGGDRQLGSCKEGLQGPNMVNGLEVSWCGVSITQDLVDCYQMANGKDITDPASGYNPQAPYTGREKRFYQSIVYDGIDWLGYEMVIRIGLNSWNEVDISSGGDNTDTGYYLRKGIDPKNCTSGMNRLSGTDQILFRYAEVLLSYAEAQNEAVGPDQSVYDAVNEVRNRSFLPDLPAGLTQAEMRKELVRERRVELFFEEKRWLDLIRTKAIEEIFDGRKSRGMRIDLVDGTWVYSTFECGMGEMTFNAPKNYLLPIPITAIDRNDKIKQNPGY